MFFSRVLGGTIAAFFVEIFFCSDQVPGLLEFEFKFLWPGLRRWHGRKKKNTKMGKLVFPPRTSCFGINPTFLSCLEAQGIIYIYIYTQSQGGRYSGLTHNKNVCDILPLQRVGRICPANKSQLKHIESKKRFKADLEVAQIARYDARDLYN